MDSVPLIGSLVILAAVFVMILIGKIVAHLFSIIMLACAYLNNWSGMWDSNPR